MIIISSQERNEINVDINLVVKDGGRLDIYPSVKNFFSIDYKPKNNSLMLFSGKFIGLIPVNANLSIDIKPKFSISNLTRMISLSGENIKALGFFSRSYSQNDDDSQIIHKFLIESFIREIRFLYQEGLLKTYEKKEDLLSFIKGKINFPRTIQCLWSNGKFDKIFVEYDDFTPNNEINKFIKYALLHSLDRIRCFYPEQDNLIKEIIFFLNLFDEVSDYNESDLERIIVSDFEFGKLRAYYENIVKISKIILSKGGISFDRIGNDIYLNSFYIDMETIFEKYLFTSIKNYYSLNFTEYSLFDGNTNGKKKFFNELNGSKNDAKPDIIIKHDDKVCLIGDAKYKTKTKETDRYQIISHALSYNCKLCVLILPQMENYSGPALIKLGTVGHDFKIEVYEYYFNLSNPSLLDEEKSIANALNLLIN